MFPIFPNINNTQQPSSLLTLSDQAQEECVDYHTQAWGEVNAKHSTRKYIVPSPIYRCSMRQRQAFLPTIHECWFDCFRFFTESLSALQNFALFLIEHRRAHSHDSIQRIIDDLENLRFIQEFMTKTTPPKGTKALNYLEGHGNFKRIHKLCLSKNYSDRHAAGVILSEFYYRCMSE